MNMIEDEAVLIARAQVDPEAFRILYEMYVDKIYRFVYYRVSQHQETAEDLTAEVFAKALHALPRFRYQGHPYSTYLYTVARSVCADFYKKQKHTEDIENKDISDKNQSMQGIEQSSDMMLLWEKIATLPVTLQEMLRLRYMEDLTHEEIARSMGKSPGAVRTALSRAISQLQDMYE